MLASTFGLADERQRDRAAMMRAAASGGGGDAWRRRAGRRVSGVAAHAHVSGAAQVGLVVAGWSCRVVRDARGRRVTYVVRVIAWSCAVALRVTMSGAR